MACFHNNRVISVTQAVFTSSVCACRITKKLEGYEGLTELLAIMQILRGTRTLPHPNSLPLPPGTLLIKPTSLFINVAIKNTFWTFSVFWNERQTWTTVFHLSPPSMKRLTINLFWRANPLTCRTKVSSGFLLLNHNSNLSPLSPTFSVRPKSVVWIKEMTDKKRDRQQKSVCLKMLAKMLFEGQGQLAILSILSQWKICRKVTLSSPWTRPLGNKISEEK